MDLLVWLENSAFVGWLIATTWVYPWVISFHSIGMGFLVGVIFVIGLRVLGVGSFPIAPLERFLLVVRIAFGVSLVTGTLLFVLDAAHFYSSPTFRIKMLLIVVGALSGLMLSRRVFGNGGLGAAPAPAATRVLAAVALASWAGAIVAGRLTAYLP